MISIIVPVYNVALYVEACIKSVMRQSYDGPIECIIVDDCGTDNSMSIVERLVAGYMGPISFKVLHHTCNRGLSAARNTGMDAAKGDYLFFLDSDDELTEDCIEKLATPLKNEQYDMVLGDLINIRLSDNNEWIERKTNFKLKLEDKTILRDKEILKTHKRGWNQLAQNKLYKAAFIKENRLRFKEGLLHEDNLWGFQIAYFARSLYVVKYVTYLWRHREGSITYLYNGEERKQSYIIIMKEMNTFIKEYNIEDVAVYPIYNSLFYSVLRYYSSNFADYVNQYKLYRLNGRLNISRLWQIDHLKFRDLFFDVHYLLPKAIAPYWQFGVEKTIWTIRKIRHRQ